MMYLLWKKSENGNLLLAKEGLKNFVAGMLPSGYVCEDIGLSSDSDEVLATISLPDIYSTLEVDLIEEKVVKFFETTGLHPRITWGRRSERNVPFFKPLKKASPVFAGSVVACLVAIYHLGFSGTFSVILSGVIAAIAVYLVSHPDGKRTLRSLKEHYWR